MPSPGAKIGIIVDTREKLPWAFRRLKVVGVESLPTGDYAPEGMVGVVTVERKSVADLVATMIADRERWVRELERMLDHKASCVIVEGTLDDVVHGHHRTSAPPMAIERCVSQVLAMGVPILFAGDRIKAVAAAESFIEEAVNRIENKRQM